MSRRYGGIHFQRADLGGRTLGRLVVSKAWQKAQAYFDGTAKPQFQQPEPMTTTAAAPNLQ